jgi:hypothetical protein
VSIDCFWRGEFANAEANELHAEAFETRVYSEDEWNWNEQVRRHSLGWVIARGGDRLVGFVNVPWDGLVHAWIQDTMAPPTFDIAASAPSWLRSPSAKRERPVASGSTSTSRTIFARSTSTRAASRPRARD